jgi:hypothetical protein
MKEDFSHPEGNELYELFAAELAARRERLNQLIRLVTLEVDRSLSARNTGSWRFRCRPVPGRTTMES